MFDIVEKSLIAPGVTLTVIRAPKIARKRRAGQFVILRLYEEGERIPLTIADADPDAGTITVVSQAVGKTTTYLAAMPVTEPIPDVVGPLGHPTHIEKVGHVVCIGGGIGIAPIHPIAQAMHRAGNRVTAILGGRSREYVILEDLMRRAAHEVLIATDDGSYGIKGFVTDVLAGLLVGGETVDQVVAIGPVPMMKAVAELTRKHGIPTTVSLNAVMVDGTGMCGACRVTVGGETKFTCVDGPEFDGHKVDFNELMQRLKMFERMEPEERNRVGSEGGSEQCARKRESADDK